MTLLWRLPVSSDFIISLGHASSSPEKGRGCSKRSFPCDLYGQLEKSKNLIHTEADMSVLSESNCNERLGIGTPEWDRVAHSSFNERGAFGQNLHGKALLVFSLSLKELGAEKLKRLSVTLFHERIIHRSVHSPFQSSW